MQANPNTKIFLAREKTDPAATSCKAQVLSFIAVIVSVLILPMAASAAVGPAVQLLWSTQPSTGKTGIPFGQPTLITADAQGNPSALHLAASLPVTIDTVPAGHLSGGPRFVDIGAGAGNGIITFTDLQIDDVGAYSLVAMAGNGTNAVLSPTNGILTCQLWLDASDASTLILNTNNQVRTWIDKSGTANNATNVNANGLNNTPYTNSNPNFTGYAGTSVLSFYGTNRLNIDLNRITNSTFSIVGVTMLNPAVTPNNDYWIGTPFITTDRTLHIGYRNVTQYTFAFYADDLNVATPGAIPVVTSHIHAPGSKALYFNGVLAGTSGSQNLGPVNQGTVGRGNGDFHGDIAEVLVYRTNLTDIQRVGVENYLANKWLGQLSAGQASVPIIVTNDFPPTGFTFTQQPTDTTAGATITPGVSIAVTNSHGAPVTNWPITISLSSGNGTLNGTLVQNTDNNGLITFGDLNLTVAGQKQLTVTIPAIFTNASSTFNIIAAAPVQLARITNASANATAGVPFPRQPIVAVEDQFGNVVSNVTDTITVSQNGNGTINATAGNSVSIAAVAGTATFSGIFITNSGTSTLTFTDSTLSLTTNSPNIAVAANVPNSLAIVQQPSSSALIGVVLDIQPIVSAADVYGNSVTNGTLISVGSSAGAVSGTTNVPTAGGTGTATYSGLSITNQGTITLIFTAGTVSTNSTPISVTPGPAVSVIWTTQPGGALTGSPFTQQPVLKTVDAGGNITTLGLGPTNLVVVHLISGSGLVGDTLIYNIGTDGSNGVITFQNLQINNGGGSNVLAADFIGSMADPTNTVPNCVLWLDAYDTHSVAMDSSNNVVTWTDKSGITNNAWATNNFPGTNINSALRLSAYGGQHAVSFFGSNWLNINLDSLVANQGGYTIFVVDVAGTLTQNNYLLGSDIHPNDPPPAPPYDQTDGVLHFGYRNPNGFTAAQYADDLTWTAPANFAAATPRLWTVRIDGNATRQIFLNGIQEATSGVNVVRALTNSTVGRGNGGNYIGDLSEVIVYSRGLDDTERANVEAYLNHKWFSTSRGLTAPFVVGSIIPTVTAGPNGTNVTVTVKGASGTTYRLLASPNLTLPLSSWTPIGTNTMNGTGVWQFNDPVGSQTRFYRAVTP
jgi:hypothetical protein